MMSLSLLGLKLVHICGCFLAARKAAARAFVTQTDHNIPIVASDIYPLAAAALVFFYNKPGVGLVQIY